ncbi:MgtC/SapB family protein [Candidatus Nitronereus thalassa]|uniref:MgtC/SapB family protein n=1 Tax=Candidatus Nitronereus thalassa TaxID=3020898 RepID=A0ABU3KB91_9BACT|nr:MgtC/SapB family protein [Candidatus Nitronereus thalassa]MDT7043760.1 MgtC/SapB family protein [Candidatus Nitronereus thalassa]
MDVLLIELLQIQILGHVVAAMVLGGIVGLDRELANRPAGIRTHSLVAGAAALFVSMGQVLVEGFHSNINVDVLRSDPIRLIEAVITGVSFLGAGTIIRQQSADRVHGLTTAASILIVAGIGVCVALGQYILAIGVTGLVWVVLRGLHHVEARLGTASTRNLG